jgi:hypothetical protein
MNVLMCIGTSLDLLSDKEGKKNLSIFKFTTKCKFKRVL